MFKFHTIQMPLNDEAEQLDVQLPDDKTDTDILADVDKEEEEEEEEKVGGKEEEEEEEELDAEGNPVKKEEKPEEEEDLVRHSYSDIKTKYPNFFKEFPGLKTAFFREQEFTKRFASLEDADEAVQAQQAYEDVRELVISGDANSFLEQVAEVSPKGMKAFAQRFLPALNSVDRESYLEITRPVVQGILSSLYKHGMDKGDKNIYNAAKIAHFEIFGSYDIGKGGDGKGTKPEPDEDFEKEKQEFHNKKYNGLAASVNSELGSELVKVIEKGLDPTNSIRPGLKKILVDKIQQEVDTQLAGDKDHIARMNSLWRREQRNGFSGALKNSIKTAYLSRANALIPGIRKKIRSEVLETQVEDDQNKTDKLKGRTTRTSVGKDSRSSSSRVPNAKEARSKNMGDKDILSKLMG